MIPPTARAARPSRVDDVVALIDARQENVAEVDGPQPIIDLLEAADVLLQRVREEQQALREPDRPRIRHAFGNLVARVLDRRDVPRVRTGRRLVQRGGRRAAARLVGRLKARCWAGRCACGGRAVAALRVRCIRSWAPFCWGLAGRMRWC